jgi:lipopolysaccharide transport system permease protein
MSESTTARSARTGDIGVPDSATRTIITPPSGRPSLGLGELWRYRSICLVLARRSLMVRYRQTVVGAAWALIQPILLMIVFTIFFGMLARVPTEGLPFAVFFYLGLMVQGEISKILTEGSTSIVNNAVIVKKIYFPRAYFPIAVALTSLVDLAFSFVALAVLLIFHNIIPGPGVAFVPVFIAVAVLAGLGVAFWLSALNVAYRDIAQMLPFLSQMWMFLSPVIYPSSLIPEAWQPFYWLNPAVLAIDGFRWAFAQTPAPPPLEWLIGASSAAVLFVTGYVFFRRREPGFTDFI